jgi:K+:H+ antiporter
MRAAGENGASNAKTWHAPAWCAFLFLLNTGAAYAAPNSNGPSEVVFITELMVLMVVGRLLGEAMHRIGQPSVMGQLLAGIVLGPSVLGWLWPDLQQWIFPASKEQKSMLDAVSQWGILLLLLLTGMETDLKLVRKVGRAALSISITGVAVPFVCGAALGWFLPESILPTADKRLVTALFLGTALSISSIKIVAAIVREMNFTRRNLGQVIVASAIMEDTIGWIIIAITFSLAEAGTIDLVSVSKSVLGTALFMLASFTVGRRLVFYCIRWSNDHFESDFPVITTILVIMTAMALTTHFLGVHTVLGAFVAGVLIGESPILTRHIDDQLRGLILAFFMPVFFGVAGLSTDLTILKDPQLLLMALGLIAIASIGKFAGAFLGGELGGLTRREAFALACGMNARGSTEVIVASIGLSMGALNQELFTMIVAMAVTTTMAMPPMLRWALSRVPITKSEQDRLEREEIEARGFVPNLERLLLAVDGSSSGRFATRVAGLLAGARGLPITVLPLEQTRDLRSSDKEDTSGAKLQEDKAASTKETIKAAAEAGKTAQPEEDRPSTVDVIVRDVKSEVAEAVEKEAERGHDLLFIGLASMRNRGGGIHHDVARVAQAFDGPLAIVAAHGRHAEDPDQGGLRILLPINGTETSRRAAELAITAARVVDGSITALYVSNPRGEVGARRSRRSRLRAHEHAILKDIVRLADQYDMKIKTAVRTGIAPEEAILHEANANGFDLVVLGADRRPGDKLFFGDTAMAVFDKAPASIVLLST